MSSRLNEIKRNKKGFEGVREHWKQLWSDSSKTQIDLGTRLEIVLRAVKRFNANGNDRIIEFQEASLAGTS
jgi:hypothetical protein